MAKIEFSPVFAAGLPQRLIDLNSATGGSTASGVGLLRALAYNTNPAIAVHLLVFKGTKLTKSEMLSSRNLGAASTPFRIAIDSNSLLKFNNLTSEWWSGNFRNTVISGDIATINTEFVAASSSGSATWFCLFHVQSNTLTSGNIGNFITGDVGITGSGADIEIPDTNLTSGELYRILGWKLKFPSSWEY